MEVKIEAGWKEKLREEFRNEYFDTLTQFVREEYRSRQVFPPGNMIFNAFDLCPFDKVKVVIIGQDPYHNTGQAHGLCFSVTDGTDFPPSLVNIFKELNRDLGVAIPKSGNLERWAGQGVLLLNAILTVRAHQALSHEKRGWERFTDAAISALNRDRDNLVFMLWGAYAQNKGASIDPSRHLVLKTVHPSPLSASRGFFGCSHFSKCNEWLTARGIEPVAW
ncbi:MAG: uracil-DNA glycosylase [Bacteroidales bacterium]|jgi:uracil-DNA glycosylase|nr:uracil-DNA glycosylase [Bacteroidales bacterium]